VDDSVKSGPAERPISVVAVGALVSFLDTSGFDRRRFKAVNRLRALRDSEQFQTLPDDLRQRVREIVADTDR
jgi:hypothetical protein